ncbi:hypothetical protein GJ496_007394 [Pomphorhynchus laevis]|nr:hypothetical protein GJ496_007394 [Pomphorhynchus laevis]
MIKHLRHGNLEAASTKNCTGYKEISCQFRSMRIKQIPNRNNKSQNTDNARQALPVKNISEEYDLHHGGELGNGSKFAFVKETLNSNSSSITSDSNIDNLQLYDPIHSPVISLNTIGGFYSISIDVKGQSEMEKCFTFRNNTFYINPENLLKSLIVEFTDIEHHNESGMPMDNMKLPSSGVSENLSVYSKEDCPSNETLSTDQESVKIANIFVPKFEFNKINPLNLNIKKDKHLAAVKHKPYAKGNSAKGISRKTKKESIENRDPIQRPSKIRRTCSTAKSQISQDRNSLNMDDIFIV